MKYTGVVFDFNGTLFWDTKLHNEAWRIFADKYKLNLSETDMFGKIHGKNNRDIFLSLFDNNISDDEINKLIAEKEGLYQELCLKTDMNLAPGVEPFFDFLKHKNIPFTIATASGKENLDFYFRYLPLNKWFEYDKVVYNDGTMRGKPNPDLYDKAMKIIGRQPQEVVVFEDANMGLLAAKNAHAGRIIAVDSNGDDYSEWKECQIITNYDQVDRSIFA